MFKNIVFLLLFALFYKKIYNIEFMQFIDLRSDTVTQPTKQMRDAILTTQYGDWAYNEDEVVKSLERRAAEMLEKQDATFVLTGTFGNQIVLHSVCQPGEEVLIGDKSHIVRYENGSLALWSRLMARTIPSDENGFVSPQTLRKFIRKIRDSQAPKSSILCLENPTCQGRIYPPQLLNELVQIGKSENLHVHLDGARIFHAAIALKTDAKQLVKDFDTVMFCLSKGLGSPLGSMVAGSKKVIQKIRVNRKRLGALLRKPGMIVQSGHISLDNIQNFIGKSHQSAQLLASELNKLGWVQIVTKVDINMIFFKFLDPESNKQKEIKRLDLASLKDFLLTKKIKVFLSPNYTDTNRLVTHHYIGEEEVHKFISTLKEFYEKSE